MGEKNSVKQLLRSISDSEKREQVEQRRRDKLRKQLAVAIAKQKGIVIGQFYYALPLGTNGRDGRKFRAEVMAVDTYWTRDKRGNHISVLLKYYNRNGAFRTEWVTTLGHEFQRIEGEANHGQ